MNKPLISLIVLSSLLISCGGGDHKKNAEAKGAKGVYSIIIDNPQPSANDVEFVKNAHDGNTRRAKAMLAGGDGNIYSADTTGLTALMAAAVTKNSELVDAILGKTSQGDQKVLDRGDNDGKTPLIYAAQAGDADIVTAIRKKGANPNVFDKSLNFPLLVAATTNNTQVAEALLKNISGVAANPDLQTSSGETAAIAAAKNAGTPLVTTPPAIMNGVPSANAGARPMQAPMPNNMAATGQVMPAQGIPQPQALPPTNQQPAQPMASNEQTEKSKEMLKLLVQYNANLNLSDLQGITPLITAVASNNRPLFDYILSLGADINGVSENETPLIYALQVGNYDFAKYILGKGGNPNAFAKGSSSPLQVLASKDNADAGMAEALIGKGAKLAGPEMAGGSVIGKAVHKGNAKLIKTLLAHGAKVTDLASPTSSGILQALAIDDPETAVLLINSGDDINKADDSGFTPLAMSARKKFDDVFTALITKGVDVNQTSKNTNAVPLEIVIDNNDAEALDLMLKNGLKANPDVLLLQVVSEKKDNLIPVLVKAGARINVMNNSNQPALWLAVAKDDLVATQVLAEGGAILDVQDDEKALSPLSLAIAKNDSEIAKYLIGKGANPNLIDKSGYTSLTYAATSGQTEIVKMLLEHHAEVNAYDTNGNTILTLVDLSRLPKDKKEEIKQLLTTAGAKSIAQPPADAAQTPATSAAVPTMPAQATAPAQAAPAPTLPAVAQPAPAPTVSTPPPNATK